MTFYRASAGLWILAVLIAFSGGGLAWCQATETVELGFEGPATLSGPEGSTVGGSYFSTLTQTSGSSGAQGWSIIMDASNATFTSVTIDGTYANPLIDREPCDEQPQCSFETYQMGSGFACSAVILSFRTATTLPTSGTFSIMQFGIETVVPPGGGSVEIEYLDVGGCFAGVADTNVVTIQGESVTFANGLLSQVPLHVGVVVETVSDPMDLIQALRDDVAALNANKGVKNALDAMLSAALGLLSDADPDNDGAAVNILEAFIAAVSGLSGGAISNEDADALIASAQVILDLLSEA